MKSIKLKKFKDILKSYNENYFIYKHKTISHRWEIAYHPTGQNNPSKKSYPITVRKGWNTLINIQRLKAIIKHFNLPKNLIDFKSNLRI